jgi:thiamine biosynthesis lipoprotein
MDPETSGGSAASTVTPDGWTALGASIQLVVTDPAGLERGRAMLAADLAEADAACNRLRPDSELATLDRRQVQSPVDEDDGTDRSIRSIRVSPLLADAIAVALRTARLTGGDVDPAIGQAAAAGGLDGDSAIGQAACTAVPGEESAFGEAAEVAGLDVNASTAAPSGPSPGMLLAPVPRWQQIRLDRRSRLLRLPTGVGLDLGATARAWAADRGAARLAASLGCGVLVAIGGDVAVAGQAPRGGWRIRVQEVTGHPEEPPRGPFTVVAILDGGLATSGTAARRRRRGPDLPRYVSDPGTGLPVAPFWRTVSVAAASCTAASAASTTAMIRGRRALDWLAALRLPARLVGLDGRVHTVAGWPSPRTPHPLRLHARQPDQGWGVIASTVMMGDSASGSSGP